MAQPDELTFIPLGGIGEIGMKLSSMASAIGSAQLSRRRPRRVVRRRRAYAGH